MKTRIVLLAVAACFVLVSFKPARAIPRYSALYEQNCGLCHINPTGGGQRSAYAVQQLIPKEIAARPMTPEQISLIDPQIGKNLSVGFDSRTIAHLADHRNTGYDDFLQMQGNVYLSFQLDPRFTAFLNQGLHGTFEVFGLGQILPLNGYVKVGQFTPAYGWRFADHTMFVRQKPLQFTGSLASLPLGSPSDLGLGGAPPPSTDVGIEASIYPQRLALVLGLTNGNLGSNLDNNDHPAVSAQALYRLSLAGIGIGAGGSFWRNSETYGTHTASGPYGYLKWKRLVWLGEVDWSRFTVTSRYRSQLTDPLTGAEIDKVTNRTITQELSWLPLRGLTVAANYDFFDPDTERQSGSRSRYGLGLEFMPYSFVVLHGTVETHRFDEGTAVAGTDYTQVEFQAHILY